MKLLTSWQRQATLEYLFVHDNLPRCRTVARELVDEAYSIIEEQDYRRLDTAEAVELAILRLNELLSEAVERWLDLHKLYDHRDRCQFTVIRDRGTFRPVPGTMIRMMLDGESKLDLCEFHKLDDGALRNLAAPYYIEDLDAPLAQIDRDRMTQEVTAWLQPLYQFAAFQQIVADVQREAHKFDFEIRSEGVSRKLQHRINEQLAKWLEHHSHLRQHSHNFSIHVENELQYEVEFSPDFQLLGRGEHPLDFVNITRDKWSDHTLRATHHEEKIKELKGKFRNV